MYKTVSINLEDTWYYIFSPKRGNFVYLFPLKIKAGVCKLSIRNLPHGGIVNLLQDKESPENLAQSFCLSSLFGAE